MYFPTFPAFTAEIAHTREPHTRRRAAMRAHRIRASSVTADDQLLVLQRARRRARFAGASRPVLADYHEWLVSSGLQASLMTLKCVSGGVFISRYDAGGIVGVSDRSAGHMTLAQYSPVNTGKRPPGPFLV